MADTLQFVDRIASSPTVRLDLNDDTQWGLDYEGTDFSPPPLRRAYADTLLVDGARIPAAAYENRRLQLRLDLKASTVDAAATQIQALARELNRPANILKWKPGTTEPVFFRTFRSPLNRVTELPGTGTYKTFDVQVEAEPLACGLKESARPVLNANPLFETDASGWFVNSGEGSIVRSTAQAHDGVASLLLTPDGVGTQAAARSVAVSGISAGQVLRGSAWMRCEVARTVRLRIDWRDGGGTFLSSTNVDISVAANTWTFFTLTGTAPGSTAQAGIAAVMTGTPPASHRLYIDDATLSEAIVVSNDPDAGAVLNANPFFETDASNWTGVGGTAVRSTAQSHEGAASLLLTPDGVTAVVEARAELVAVTAGVSYRASAWVRCAVARNINLNINWHTAAAFLTTSTATVAVLANTWTFVDLTATAPAAATQARLLPSMTGTPPGSNTLHIDEAKLWQPGSPPGGCFDLTGIKGDVETPLILSRPATNRGDQSLFAVRRRGNPAAAPFLLQAEAMTQGPDTVQQANSATFSGAGSNYSRCTFGTVGGWAARLSASPYPSVASVDARGTYRAFARLRKNGTSGDVQVRLCYGGVAPLVTGDPILVTWTSLAMVDFGLVPIPIGADPVHDGFSGVELPARGILLELQAQRISGTDTLDVDYLMLVPADDRLAIVNWPTGSADTLVIDGSHDTSYGAMAASGEVVSMVPGYHVGGLPMVSPGVTNRIFHINEVKPGDPEPTFPAVADFTAWYHPRYLYIRGPST